MQRVMARKEPEKEKPLAKDLLWGVASIAHYLGIPIRRAHQLIGEGRLPVIRKLEGRMICARKSELDRWFSSENEGAAAE